MDQYLHLYSNRRHDNRRPSAVDGSVVMAYELQAPDDDHIPEEITYDSDVSAASENYEASFPRPIGVTLHWLKQP